MSEGHHLPPQPVTPIAAGSVHMNKPSAAAAQSTVTVTASNVNKRLREMKFEDLPFGTVVENKSLREPPPIRLPDKKQWKGGGRTLTGVAWRVGFKTEYNTPANKLFDALKFAVRKALRIG